MCTDRLAVGEAPACVQACPHEAIAIRLVDVVEINAAASAGARIVPGAFDSGYTKPTTKYFSKRGIPKNAEPADAHALRLEHPHWPLIIMLLFSQLAVGMFVTSAVMATVSASSSFPVALAAGRLGFSSGTPTRRLEVFPWPADVVDEPGDSGVYDFCGGRISWHRALLDCSNQRLCPSRAGRRSAGRPPGCLYFGNDLRGYTPGVVGANVDGIEILRGDGFPGRDRGGGGLKHDPRF